MRRCYWWLLPLSFLAVLAAAAWLHPDPRGFGTHRALGLPPCLFFALTGLPCPSCGLTTSFTWLVHGHLWKAFVAHPFGPLLFTVYTLFAFGGTLKGLGKAWPKWLLLKRREGLVLYTLLALFLGTWLFRLFYFSLHHGFPGT